jgi:hypothetical protein
MIENLEIGIYNRLVAIASTTGRRVNVYRESDNLANTISDSIIEACTFMISVKSGSFDDAIATHQIEIVGIGDRHELITFLTLFFTNFLTTSIASHSISMNSYEFVDKSPDLLKRSLKVGLSAVSESSTVSIDHPFLNCA